MIPDPVTPTPINTLFAIGVASVMALPMWMLLTGVMVLTFVILFVPMLIDPDMVPPASGKY